MAACTTDNLAQQHTTEAIARRIASATKYSDLGDVVLGAVDGTISTFAIVAGVAGAGMASGVAIVLGLANVLAAGFSMAVSNYFRARADRQIVERTRRIEEMHIDEIPDGEREEIRQIFAGKGFTGEMLEQVVAVITRERKQWVDTMLTEEWGLRLEPPCPLRAAVFTIIGFIVAGLVPLLPLFLAAYLATSQMFVVSAGLTAITFFLIGFVRGRVTDRRAWFCAFETLLVGGAAAVLAYGVGVLFKGIVA